MRTTTRSAEPKLAQTTLLFLVIGLALLSSATVTAQSYAINWYALAGGGGASQGGRYSLSGIIGQAVAVGGGGSVENGSSREDSPSVGNSPSGGRYALSAGHGSRVRTVATPGAPKIDARLDPESRAVTVFWKLPDRGWVLETSSTLGGAPDTWADVPTDAYQHDGTYRLITIQNLAGNAFYRLRPE